MPQHSDGKTRTAVTAHSRPSVQVLSRLPTWLLPAVVVALVLVGLFGSAAVGVPALAVVAVLLGWLGYLSWPALPSGGRVLRVGVVVVTVAAVVAKAVGRL